MVAIGCDARKGYADVRFGSKADIVLQKVMSALPPKADMCSAVPHVRFHPNSGLMHRSN